MFLMMPSNNPYTAVFVVLVVLVVEVVERDEWGVGSDWKPKTTGFAANIARISNGKKELFIIVSRVLLEVGYN
jgi:hypothetical protein